MKHYLLSSFTTVSRLRMYVFEMMELATVEIAFFFFSFPVSLQGAVLVRCTNVWKTLLVSLWQRRSSKPGVRRKRYCTQHTLSKIMN